MIPLHELFCVKVTVTVRVIVAWNLGKWYKMIKNQSLSCYLVSVLIRIVVASAD